MSTIESASPGVITHVRQGSAGCHNPGHMAAASAAETHDAGEEAAFWRPISLVKVLRQAPFSRPARIILALWLAGTLLCIALGIYQVNRGWNGIPVHLGPIRFSMTIYPPLIICVWMLFWLGFEWAFLAAYLATWTLSVYAGMPLTAASLFALVDPLALAIYALAYRTARLPFDLRQAKSAIWFIVVSFVAAVAGSTGSFIWSEARGLSAADTLAIWQGWWIGAFAQALILNAPVLAILSRRLEGLKRRYFRAPVVAEPTLRWIASAIAAGGVVLAGFLMASSELASVRLFQALATDVSATARRAILDASYSWKLTAWAGMALTLAGSLGGMFLAYAWNRALFREVRLRTAELQESEQRFRLTFEQAAVGIAHVGLDGRWLRVNQKLCDIVGYTYEELLRLTFQDITYPEDLDADLVLVRKALAGEITNYAMEKRYIRKNGSLTWIQLTVALARGPQNDPSYFISIVEDINERKQLEEQLRHSQKMEAIGRLAGGVAHDFNNLLTVISGYGEIMMRETSREPLLRSKAEAICAAADRAAVLTHQLLAFSRRQLVQPRIVDLNHVVAKMEQMLHRLIGEKVVLTTIRCVDPARVKIDPGQIEQVIVNLAVNAQDSMPDGGTLTIEVGRGSIAGTDGVTLEVRDEGTGMTADVLAHLYEPFFTTKARGKGTGLGLSIVYGIIKQAGGTIDVQSQLSHGTTFRIVLPEVTDAESHPETRSISEPAVPGSETVMLVEDEDALRALAAQVLRANGYTVLEASTGEDAERTCTEFSGEIALLVTDVVMPGMNGPALVERLRSSQPLLRVLYISGYTENVLDVQGELGPLTEFLQKPFAPSVLVHQIRKLLDVVI
jgi:PAS domain S-box-containing protein